jgi:hypothetical protein
MIHSRIDPGPFYRSVPQLTPKRFDWKSKMDAVTALGLLERHGDKYR